MRTFFAISAAVILLSGLPVAAQQSKQPMPRVLRASVPRYPPLARQASIEGEVVLRISTDGLHLTNISSESGHPLLVKDAEDNVKSWEFAEHTPKTFVVRFTYKLTPAPPCESEADPEDPKNQSVLLQLPISVEVKSVRPYDCVPAVTIKQTK